MPVWYAKRMTETLILTPGHPAGCSCGECGCRRAHLEGAHQGDDCQHGICLICTGCAECEEREREEYHAGYIADLVASLDQKVADALTATNHADGGLRELTSNRVYDVELAESTVGADMLAELADAARHLRNAKRIIEWRVGLFKER